MPRFEKTELKKSLVSKVCPSSIVEGSSTVEMTP